MSEGKRTTSTAGAKTKTKKKKARRGGKTAAVVVILAVVVAALIPCVMASATQQVFPGVSVAGIKVGGMSQSEAATLLQERLPAAYNSETLPITVDNAGGAEVADMELDISALGVSVDAQAAAQAAQAYGRGGNFLTDGMDYIKGMVGGAPVNPTLTMDEEAAKTQIAALAAQADQPVEECAWRVEGDKLYITKGTAGYLMDQAAALESTRAALADYDFSGITFTLVQTEPKSVTMEDIYNDVHSVATNAYYDKESGTVKDGDPGIEFDAAAAQSALDSAAPGEEFPVAVTLTAPTISKEQMQSVLFRDKLGTCTTSAGGSAARRNNITLASRACNGVVLNPGETFSYNNTLGQRTAAKGYQAAPAYVGGKTVDEIGGGICQVSSTLYLATLRSNLKIASRTAHMYRASYIPYGMDATVSWGGPDYQFTNNTDYPIKLNVSYSGGQVTATIYGTNVTGNYAKMEYEILATIPSTTVEKEDPTQPVGTRTQEQSAYTGYKVVTYRCVYDSSGKLISRTQEAVSNYKKRDQIILVGTQGAVVTPPTTEPGTGTDSGTGTDTGTGTGDGAAAGTENGATTPETPAANTTTEPAA